MIYGSYKQIYSLMHKYIQIDERNNFYGWVMLLLNLVRDPGLPNKQLIE